MEFYDDLKLIKITTTKDGIGQEIKSESSTEVLCKPSVVGSREFYNAMAVGIRPSAELLIRQSNYDNETEVEYKGIRYSIIRTIPKDKFNLVLVIGVKEGVNN